MANFDTSGPKRASVREAANLLSLIQATYAEMKIVQASLAKYQANSDPAFNAAINALFSASERSELGQMLAGINILVTDWETNHAGALQG